MLVKEKQCKKVVKVSKRNDKNHGDGNDIWKRDTKRDMYLWPQVGRPFTEKQQFYNDLANEWNLCSSAEMLIGLGDFNCHI